MTNEHNQPKVCYHVLTPLSSTWLHKALFPTCDSTVALKKKSLFLAKILSPSLSASLFFRTQGKSWLGHRPCSCNQDIWFILDRKRNMSFRECCASIKHLFVVAHISGETLSKLAVWKPRSCSKHTNKSDTLLFMPLSWDTYKRGQGCPTTVCL